MNAEKELDWMKENLEAIRKWERIQGLESLERVLDSFNKESLIIYNQADGNTSIRTISKEVESGRSTVSKRLQNWSKQGLVEKDGQQWKHVAPLSAIGIEEPELDLKSEKE